MPTQKLEDYGKSVDLAQNIELIKAVALTIDLEYAALIISAQSKTAGSSDNISFLKAISGILFKFNDSK